MPTYTHRPEYVRCGKGCKGCPHGPYWYAYWREAGRLRKKYIGKVDPRKQPGKPEEKPDPWDAIFDRSKATLALALEILENPPQSDEGICRFAFRRLALLHHPDRGGDVRRFQQCEAAWSYLRSAKGWK